MLYLWFGIFCESLVQVYFVSVARTMKPVLDLIPLAQLELIQKEGFLTLAASPIIAFFGIYLFAGALHFVITGFGFSTSKDLKYENTLTLVSVCQKPMLWAALPLVGPILASVLVFMRLFQGLRANYKLSPVAAFASILLPALFLKLSWGSALQLIALSV